MTQNQLAFNRNVIAEAELHERERSNKAQEAISSMKNEISALEAETKRGQLFLDTVSNPYVVLGNSVPNAATNSFISSPTSTGISFLDSSTIWDNGATANQQIGQGKEFTGIFANIGQFFRGIGSFLGSLF